MKTELIYFDTSQVSAIGTLRGLVGVLPLVLSSAALLKLVDELIKIESSHFIWLYSVLIGLVLTSALGVQNEKSLKQSLYYSSLVFFVVYSIVVFTLMYITSNILLLAIIPLSILFGAANGYIMFKFAPRFK